MTEPHMRQAFGGIDSNTDDGDCAVPSYYRDTLDGVRRGDIDFPTFHEVLQNIHEWYSVEAKTAYYYDGEADEYVEVPNRVALVNPAWLGAEARENAPQNSAAWTTASDSHSENDGMDHFGPLVAASRQESLTACFGCVYGYRNGGDVTAEIFYPDMTAGDAELGDGRYVLGFELNYDYFKKQSVGASVVALDTQNGTVLRGLSDSFSSPTRGDVSDRLGDWFLTMFERAEKVGNALVEAIVEAREYEVDLSNMPLTVQDFYESLGFTAGMSQTAAEQVRNNRYPTAWELYEPITQAITTEFDGKVGDRSLVEHASRANELLYSPAQSERLAYENAAEKLEGQATLSGDTDEDAADVLRNRAESLDEAVDNTLTFKERVRHILDEGGESGASDDASDETGEDTDADEGASDGGAET